MLGSVESVERGCPSTTADAPRTQKPGEVPYRPPVEKVSQLSVRIWSWLQKSLRIASALRKSDLTRKMSSGRGSTVRRLRSCDASPKRPSVLEN